MDSRQRVKTVLDHKISDKIPIDLGSNNCSGISMIAYNRLRKALGLNGFAKMYDINMQLAYPEKEILDLFEIDIIDAGQAFLKSKNDWVEWEIDNHNKCLIPKYLNLQIDKNGTVFLKDNENCILGIKHKSSLYVNQSYWVWKNLANIPNVLEEKELNKYSWAIPIPPFNLDFFNDKHLSIIIDTIKNLFTETNYSIALTVWCGLIEAGSFLRGFENFLCDVYIDQKRVYQLLEKLTDNYLKLLEKIINSVGNYIDILCFGDDIAYEDSMFFSPEILKKIFIPFYKKMWNYVHDNSSCKVFFHSCGAIYDSIELLIDAGVDILNPIQTSAKGMDAIKLKKEFGKDLVFWGGGVDTRKILPFGTKNEIKEDVKKRIEIFNKGGGFVFNPIHNIQADVPPENIISCFEAVNEYDRN